MSASSEQSFRSAGLDPTDVATVIDRAFAEDLSTTGDVTSLATIAADAVATARFVARADGVIAGIPAVAMCFDMMLADRATFSSRLADGDRVARGDVIASVTGPTRGLLTVERTALNILCRLSGIATLTRSFADALAGTNAKVRDTRKTTPGLRALEKYAVRCGGGTNHRFGLYDAVLIKDNHVVAAGGVREALAAVSAYLGDRKLVVQCEIDRLDQLDDALSGGADQILLDNMSTLDMTEAVRRIRHSRPDVLIEASGRLTLDRVAEVASTGVDYLAVGALTHSAPILDIALDM